MAHWACQENPHLHVYEATEELASLIMPDASRQRENSVSPELSTSWQCRHLVSPTPYALRPTPYALRAGLAKASSRNRLVKQLPRDEALLLAETKFQKPPPKKNG